MTATTGTNLTPENADTLLKYVEELEVLVCLEHKHAITNVEGHLRTMHGGSKAVRDDVVGRFAGFVLKGPDEVEVPKPGGPPIPWLAAPAPGYRCSEYPDCGFTTKNLERVKEHCRKEHGKGAGDTHWHDVHVQHFFAGVGKGRYFVVESPRPESGATPEVADPGQLHRLVEAFREDRKAHEERMSVIDATIDRQDLTGWLRRTGWAEHLQGANLGGLAHMVRAPDRNEGVLEVLDTAVDELVEKCVEGLSTMSHMSKRWLRSPRAAEPDHRPLSRLQSEKTQSRYAGHLKAFIRYGFRVRERVLAGDDKGGRHSDAVRLFRWHPGQVRALDALREKVYKGDKVEQELLSYIMTFVFDRQDDDPFGSGLVHFLAVCGIEEGGRRLAQAHHFSGVLAGLLYVFRVLAAEYLLPSDSRKGATRQAVREEDNERFLEHRRQYLADGGFGPVTEIISLLAYSKTIALDRGNPGAISWPDEDTVRYHGQPIQVSALKAMVDSIVTEAEEILWEGLMWSERVEDRFQVDLASMRDDVSNQDRGHSFVADDHNKLVAGEATVLKRMMASGRKSLLGEDGMWAGGQVRRYLNRVDDFKKLLLLAVHITGGQPARGTEIITLRYQNGLMQDRNIFVIDGQVVTVTRYHKSYSQFDTPKVIPRFMPWRVGQLVAVCLAYVQPFAQMMSNDGAAWSDYLWADGEGHWNASRLTDVMTSKTAEVLGVRLTMRDYRHIAITVGRQKIGPNFAPELGADDLGEDEDLEGDDEDPLELSAARSTAIGHAKYGVSATVIKHLTPKSLAVFGPLCGAWHRLLGLASRSAAEQAARKRKREAAAPLTPSRAPPGPPTPYEGWGPPMRGAPPCWTPPVWNAAASPYPPVWNAAAWPYPPRWDTPAADKAVAGWGGPKQPFWGAGPATPPTSSSPLAASVSEDGGSSEAMRPPSPSNRYLGSRMHGGMASVGPSGPPCVRVNITQLQGALDRALGEQGSDFASPKQKQAMWAVLRGKSPLVVVLPTGGGKSLLFLVPACLPDPGMTVVMVPFRHLIDQLVSKARQRGIDCVEWKEHITGPRPLVFVSADMVANKLYRTYVGRMLDEGHLRRVFVDECHVAFTDDDYRPSMRQLWRAGVGRAPIIFLTATLPPVLEATFKDVYRLEERPCVLRAASGQKPKVSYSVRRCRRGGLIEEGERLCVAARDLLREGERGVVYCRSRLQAEEMAGRLGCGFVHALSGENDETLARWEVDGGLVTATSSLGTGVDYPGVVFIAHVGAPYSMIDYAQQSGRGGRRGEPVTAAVLIEEGEVSRLRTGPASSLSDKRAIYDYLDMDTGCRRRFMTNYLDGDGVSCSAEGMSPCDLCTPTRPTSIRPTPTRPTPTRPTPARLDLPGAVTSAWEIERARIEAIMTEVMTLCKSCWVRHVLREPGAGAWDHLPTDCPDRDRERAKELVWKSFREKVKFDAYACCYRCWWSQDICPAMRNGTRSACTFPFVLTATLHTAGKSTLWQEKIRTIGYEGGFEDVMTDYAKWLGKWATERIRGERVTNAMAVMVRLILADYQG